MSHSCRGKSEKVLHDARGGNRYSFGHRMMYEAPARLISRASEGRHRLGASTVIDVGSGIGYGYEVLLRERAVSRYLGVELDQDSADYARTLVPSERIGTDRVICADWLTVTEADLFVVDYVFCIEVIEHVHEFYAREFLERAARYCTRNLFVSTPRKRNGGAYDPPEALKLLRSVRGIESVAPLVGAQWTVLYVCGKE